MMTFLVVVICVLLVAFIVGIFYISKIGADEEEVIQSVTKKLGEAVQDANEKKEKLDTGNSATDFNNSVDVLHKLSRSDSSTNKD